MLAVARRSPEREKKVLAAKLPPFFGSFLLYGALLSAEEELEITDLFSSLLFLRRLILAINTLNMQRGYTFREAGLVLFLPH